MRNLRTGQVQWAGRDLVFEARTGDAPSFFFDTQSKEGPSPMETVLLALSACMAIDVKAILDKGRVPVEELTVEVEGDRAPEPPRRYLAMRLRFRVKGPAPEDLPKVERAIQLSRDKYCSVTHTLRPDLDLTVDVELV